MPNNFKSRNERFVGKLFKTKIHIRLSIDSKMKNFIEFYPLEYENDDNRINKLEVIKMMLMSQIMLI